MIHSSHSDVMQCYGNVVTDWNNTAKCVSFKIYILHILCWHFRFIFCYNRILSLLTVSLFPSKCVLALDHHQCSLYIYLMFLNLWSYKTFCCCLYTLYTLFTITTVWNWKFRLKIILVFQILALYSCFYFAFTCIW